MLKHESCRQMSFTEGPQTLTSPIHQLCQIIDLTIPMALISLLHETPNLNKCKCLFAEENHNSSFQLTEWRSI